MYKNLQKFLLIMICSVLAVTSAFADNHCVDVLMAQYVVDGNDAIPVSGDSVTIELIGRFVDIQRQGQFVRACKDSTVRYRASSTAGSVNCRVNGVNVPSEGRITINSGSKRLMCSDRPDGNDVDRIRLVSAD